MAGLLPRFFIAMRHFAVTSAATHYDSILRMNAQPLSLFFLAIIYIGSTHPARGDEADVINFSVTGNVMNDNNLFRLRPGLSAESVGLKTKSDTITSTGVGINFNKLFSLQRIVADVSLQEATYKTYDYLNYRALNYDTKWQWAIGKRLSGEVLFQRSQSLASFTDYNNYIKRNLRTVEDNRLNLDYWLHANWHLVGGSYTTKLANESAYLEDSDYDGTGYNTGLSYQPASGNKLTWRVKRMEGKYKKRQFNTLFQYDNGFTQTGQQLELYWLLTGKSALRGNLEYINREHDHFSSRDYSGWTGNLNYVYSYSGKTTLTAGYRRGLDSYQQVVSSYYRSNEFNLLGQWAATSKILASARAAYIMRQYEGPIISLPSGFPEREDKVARFGMDVSYRPDRWLELKAGATVEKRFSNFSNYEYDDRVAYISASGQF